MASIDDIWLVDFGEPFPAEPANHRPALILGPPEAFGASFPYAIVAPLTTAKRGLSLHVEIEANDDSGLDATSYVQCELIPRDAYRALRQCGVVLSPAQGSSVQPSFDLTELPTSLRHRDRGTSVDVKLNVSDVSGETARS